MRLRTLSRLFPALLWIVLGTGCEDDPADPGPPENTVATVTVSPDAATLIAVGAVKQFTAVARDANGDVVANPLFTWSSSDANVARVNSIGLVFAVGSGQTNIKATAQGVSDTALVRVELGTMSSE